MNGTQFGHCGFVPHSPTELAFAGAEENDAVTHRVKAIIDSCCVVVPAAKDQVEPMKGDDETEETKARRFEGVVDSAGPDEAV